MLHDGLAGTKGAGDCGGTALGDGEHGVNNALAAVHGAAGNILARIGSGNTDGPVLDHGELMLNALFVPDDCDDIGDNMLAELNAHDLSGDTGGNHDLVEDSAGLLHRAEHIAGAYLIAGIGDGHKIPLFLAVERGDIDAAADAVAGLGAHLGQGALDTVIDIVQHTRSKLNGHGHTGGFHNGAGAKAGGLLVDLN